MLTGLQKARRLNEGVKMVEAKDRVHFIRGPVALSAKSAEVPSRGGGALPPLPPCNDILNGKQNCLSGECDGQAAHYAATQ